MGTFPCAAVEADQNKTEKSENSFSTFSIFPLKFRIRTAKMNVPVFIDISIEEQAEEKRAYFKNLGAEISIERSEKGIEEDLQKIIGFATSVSQTLKMPGKS